jgi:hypothetical protein
MTSLSTRVGYASHACDFLVICFGNTDISAAPETVAP